MGVDIVLKHGFKVSGVETKKIHMRAPTVGDTLAADKLGGSDAEKEIAMFANLCQVAPAELHAMHMADYKKLQEAWASFFD